MADVMIAFLSSDTRDFIGCLYLLVFVLSICALWMPILSDRKQPFKLSRPKFEKNVFDGRRLGVIFNSAAILCGTVASIAWLALDPQALLVRQPWLVPALFVFGIFAVVVALLLIPSTETTSCISTNSTSHVPINSSRTGVSSQQTDAVVTAVQETNPILPEPGNSTSIEVVLPKQSDPVIKPDERN